MIARGDGTPLYNFAVAVDDAEMGITDVIRGDDHLSNTPEAAARPRGARRRAAALRAPAAAARPRRQEALQAPRRRLGPGAARRRLPAGGGAQLPRAARLGHRRRHDDPARPHELIERFAIERVGTAVGDLRRAQAALAQRPLHARAAARRVRRGGRRRSSSARATPRRRPTASACARGLRDRAGQGADADRGLAADRASCSSRRSTTRRRGEGDGREGVERALEAALRSLRAAEPFDAADARARARRARRAARRQAPRRSTSRSASRSPGRPSRRGSSTRSRRSAASSR